MTTTRGRNIFSTLSTLWICHNRIIAVVIIIMLINTWLIESWPDCSVRLQDTELELPCTYSLDAVIPSMGNTHISTLNHELAMSIRQYHCLVKQHAEPDHHWLPQMTAQEEMYKERPSEDSLYASVDEHRKINIISSTQPAVQTRCNKWDFYCCIELLLLFCYGCRQ